MERPSPPPAIHGRGTWKPLAGGGDHPLAPLDGRDLAGAKVRVWLGPTSRFGARYFVLLLEAADGALSEEPVLSGLQHSGPLPSYNWIEVAETRERVALPGAGQIELGEDGIQLLFSLLYQTLPPGGHLMVEYDSEQRAETAVALARGVPPVATPLGELLLRIGFGAHFKDWQIAEGGSEGPRKLQAYKPPSDADAARWRREAAQTLEAYLADKRPGSQAIEAARARARALLPRLKSGASGS
ncbi:MAG: DUF1122 family protein [Dehalococcoidia bacterium]|nr:DUF1122 family protein [Dehalococcoidia bacterium]